MTWKEALQKDPLYLNLGGAGISHGRREHYDNYISVDVRPTPKCPWSIQHDLRSPIPLLDSSVDRILTEDFLEHLKEEDIQPLLAECYRILKPGSPMRIGAPDYNSPRMQKRLVDGKDSKEPTHFILTTYDWMKKTIEESSFRKYKFYHYWGEGKFVYTQIDYTLGWIKRTPDNDRRNERGDKFLVTSIVVDVFKE